MTPSAASPVEQAARGPLGWAAGWLGAGGLVAVVWLGFWRFPAPPDVDLDSSWRVTLGWALAHGLQFGREVVFTEGPLGYLVGATYDGLHLWSHLLWQCGVATVGCWAVGETVRKQGLLGRVFLLGALLLFVTANQEITLWFLTFLLAALLLRDAPQDDRRRTVLLGVCLGGLALTKFTFTLFIAGAGLLALAYDLAERRGTRAAVLAVAGLGTFSLGWIGLGQQPGNLPAFVTHSLEISLGYDEAMAVDGDGAVVGAGAAALLLLAVFGVVRWFSSHGRLRASVFGLLLGAGVFMSWKQGFVRADGHQLLFFGFVLGVATSAPALFDDPPRFRRLRRGLLVAAALAALWGTWRTLPQVVTCAAGSLASRLQVNLSDLLRLPQVESRYRERWAACCEKFALPRTRLALGPRPVDVLGHHQNFAFFNGLNFRPRPVFQSYSAYSPALQRLNEQVFEASAAPAYLIQRFEAIDRRFPTLDDAGVLRLLFRDYLYLHEEGSQLVWKRRPEAPPAPLEPLPVAREAVVGFGETVAFPELAPENLWIEIDYRPTWLGRLVGFFYKLPVTTLAVTDGEGVCREYRLLRAVAGHGFLLNPFWCDQREFEDFLRGGQARRIQALAVSLPGGGRRLFEPAVRIRFARMPGPLVRRATSDDLLVACGFRDLPNTVRAFADPSAALVQDTRLLVLHAPSEMEFALAVPTERVRGSFGFVDGAWSETGGHTGGAEFRLLWVSGDAGERVLFRRRLTPFEVPADRGVQTFDVCLSGLGTGRLRLVVDALESNAFDWTGWSGVEITPAAENSTRTNPLPLGMSARTRGFAPAGAGRN